MITLNLTALTLYIMAATFGLLKNNWIPPRNLLFSLGTLALILHAAALYYNLLTPEGLNLGLFSAASLIAWVIISLLLISLPRQPVDGLLIALLPIAALTLALETAFPSQRLLSTQQSLGVLLHILSSILAYSFLSISAIQALFLAFQDHQLHYKHPTRVLQILPPLRTMEDLLFQTIGIGFLLLSISLLSGFLFLKDVFAQHLVHKTILSTLAWGVFAGLLWGHWKYGWRGKTAIRWSLSGFSVLMLAYFGSKLVLEFILHR